MEVAVGTGEREVVFPVTAPVLLRGDVLDVVAEERLVALLHPAVLTAIAGALPDQASGGCVHPAHS
jgi:hypothetical protein